MNTDKIRYTNIMNDIKKIRRRIYSMENDYRNLYNSLSSNIYIDNSTIGDDTLNKLEKNNNKLLSSINSRLIPTIRNEINKL